MMKLIATATSTGTSATISFENIPSNFTDLVLVASFRTTQAITSTTLFSYFGTALNSSIRANYAYRALNGSGTGVSSYGITSDGQWNMDPTVPGSSATANTFGSIQMYFPNYSGSTAKSVSVDSVGENNAAAAGQIIFAGLNSNTNALSAITNIAIELNANNFVSGSTASLYGITKGSDGIVTTS